jgi:4-oxalomesaconate hydratase
MKAADMNANKKTALVISAHAADFVWRAGGAIAQHQAKGYEVTVVCLSFGERGESAKLWKQQGMTLEKVISTRRAEAENAAKALDVHDIRFFDLGDYPLVLERDDKYRLVDVIRAVQPNFMMSHSQYDPYNTDHMYTTDIAMECRMIAQAWGHNPGEKVLGAPQLYLFEPHQTEQMGWKPNIFLDISDVWEKKRAAIECMEGQEHLWNYYTNVAENRGNHFRRNSGGMAGGTPSRFAEGFQAVYPQTVDELR